jgi:hypothetical protein
MPTAGPEWKRDKFTIEGDLKDPDDEPLTEEVEMWSRNILDVIQELLENNVYGDKLVFAPRREYNDISQNERRYSEMWTADWWWNLQVCIPIAIREL